MGEDYYKLLEVERGASEDDIIKAWKRLSKVYHPDKNPDKKDWADEMQKKINEAKNVLTDPQKRRVYDQFGEEGVRGGGGGGQPGGFQTFNFEDIIGNFFGGARPNGGGAGMGGFEGMFNGFFGGGRKVNPKKTFEISLTLEDVYKGYQHTKKLKIGKECPGCEGIGQKIITTCKGCDGKGFRTIIQQLGPGMIQQSRGVCSECSGKKKTGSGGNCDECKGSKVVDKIFSIDIHFDPGVEDGTVYGKTEEEIDFQFIARVGEHHLFKRDGNNLRMRKTINLYEALTGVEFSLKLLDGREILIKSKEIIKPGVEYRLERLGINGKDILITFDIRFPDKINGNGKKLLSQILDMEGEKVKKEEETEIYYL